MRKLLLLVALGFFATQNGYAQNVLLLEDFEDATVEYTISPATAEYSDGSEDYFTRTDGSNIAGGISFSNIQGTSFFAAQDLDGDGEASPQILTFSNINITGQTNLTFLAFFAEDDDGSNQDWDSGDFVHVQASIDGGATQDVLFIENDGSTFNSAPFIDTDFNGTGDGAEITDAFTQYSGSISGTGTSLTLTITVSLDGGDEDIAFDNVQVQGTTATSDTRVAFASSSASPTEVDSGTQDVTVDLVITNPSSDDTTFDFAQSGTADGADVSVSPTSFTFPGNSSANLTVTITVNGDTDIESDETVILSITNVNGGDNAAASSPDTYTLTITNDDAAPSPNAWINELHYDNNNTNGSGGGDVGEFVEISVPASFPSGSLSDLVVVRYNGSNGSSYGSDDLSTFAVGTTSNGFTLYSLTYAQNGLQNGGPDGLALCYNGAVVSSGGVAQFLSYEGSFTASGGCADGLTSTDIGVSESGSTNVGESLGLEGTGNDYADFTGWKFYADDTPGQPNTDQALPVELTSFEAIASSDAVTLSWTTASETNNAGFELQLATTSGTFTPATFVTGQGTTLEAQSYQHTVCLLYTSPSPRDRTRPRMPSSA